MEGGMGEPIMPHAEFFYQITHHGGVFFTNHASRRRKQVRRQFLLSQPSQHR